MTDLRQAAQQALDALILCRDWPGAFEECNQALQSLRTALASQHSEIEQLKAEREACAKVCDEHGFYDESPTAAIRVRGTP